MAELRPKAVLYPPGGIGLAQALKQIVQPGYTVSAFDDQTLWTAHRLLHFDSDEVNFRPLGDLVGWVSRMVGLPTHRRTGPSQLRAMVMRAAASLPQDSPLATARVFPGTAEAVAKTLTQLHYHHVDTVAIRKAAESAEPVLAQKLTDLAELEDLVRQQMFQTNQEFGADRALQCLGTQAQNPLPVPRLVIVAGHDRAPLYEDWLLWLAAQGVEIDLLLEHNGPASLNFPTTAQTLAHINPVATSQPKDSPWTSALFTETTTKDFPTVVIQETPDPLSECETALRHCFQSRQNGLPYNRIGIFVRDQEKYGPLLVASAKRLGIPLSVRLALPLLGNGFASFVLELLKALSSDDTRKLGHLASNTYLGLPPQDASFVLESSRETFQAPDPWFALTTTLTNAAEENKDLDSILGCLAWRLQFTQEDRTIAEWKRVFVELCARSPLLDHVKTSPLTQERDLRAQVLMQSVLGDILLEQGETKMSFSEFIQRSEKLWELENVVWNTEDDAEAVKVCTSTHQLIDFDQLIVLGMVEGTIPRRRSEDPVLHDLDREAINQILALKTPLPTSHDQAASERDEFVRICGSTGSSLVFSYPETGDDKDNIPAFYLAEISRVTQIKDPVKQSRSHIVPPAKDCLLAADVLLRQSLDSPSTPFHFPELHLNQTVEKAKQDPTAPLRPDQIADVLTCPFRAYFRTQSVYPRSNKTLLSILRQVPADVVLAQFQNPEDGHRQLSAQVEESLDRHIPRLQSWERGLITKGANRLVTQWVQREWKARDTFDLHPDRVEAPFYLGGTSDGFEWKIKEKLVTIVSKIPALALKGDTAVGILYKSSPPDIKPEKAWTDSLPQTVEIGLTLLGLMKTKLDVAVQIEGLENRRMYYLVRPLNLRRGVCKDPKIDTNDLAPSSDRPAGQIKREFFEELKNHVAIALDKLQSADLRPTPGEPCNACRYADLCRSHIQHGEQNSPYEGEQP